MNPFSNTLDLILQRNKILFNENGFPCNSIVCTLLPNKFVTLKLIIARDRTHTHINKY